MITKRLATIPLILMFAASAAVPARAQAQDEKPDAARIIREARYSQADQNYTMAGELSRRFEKVPFVMVMDGPLNTIRFYFPNKKDPKQIISLEIKPNTWELTEQLKGKPRKPLPQERYGEAVQGTDVTYEDISQRFLYWPDPKFDEEEDDTIRIQLGVRRDAWVIRLDNPRRDLGPYGVVKVWVDKENKSLLRVEGFDWKGHKVKRFEVNKVSKEDGVWVLSSMSVETIDQKGKRKDTTFMRMDAPETRE